MALTAFTSRLGLGQGRLAEPGTAEGSYLFVLGDLGSGHHAELAPYDYVQVTQTTDLTGVSLVRVDLELRVPSGMPEWLRWEASIRVDGVALAITTAASGRSRVITDLAANVTRYQGNHEIAVRLELKKV